MHCEDMSITKLMLAHDANGCGFSVGRAQCNSAAGHSSRRPSTCRSMLPTHIRPGNGTESEPEPRVRIWSTVGSHLDDVTPDELAAITNVLDHLVPPHVRVGDTNGALRCSHVR
jgi:hypothetical protein